MSAAEQAALLEAIIAARRSLEQLIGGDHFGDPQRDLLIELYRAALAGRLPSVSDMCSAAAVPHGTAMRHIQQLTREGRIQRLPDPHDGRRTYLRLSTDAEREMGDWTRDSWHAFERVVCHADNEG